MLGLATTSRARRAAITTLAPLIAQSRERLGTIPDTAWRQPYMMGFLGMTISLAVTQQMTGRLSPSRLGNAQVGAWTALTGIADDLVGEDLCYLSASRHKDFMLGCRNAQLFVTALNGDPDTTHPDIVQAMSDALHCDVLFSQVRSEQLREFGRGGAVAAVLWLKYFEAPLRSP